MFDCRCDDNKSILAQQTRSRSRSRSWLVRDRFGDVRQRLRLSARLMLLESGQWAVDTDKSDL